MPCPALSAHTEGNLPSVARGALGAWLDNMRLRGAVGLPARVAQSCIDWGWGMGGRGWAENLEVPPTQHYASPVSPPIHVSMFQSRDMGAKGGLSGEGP